MPNFLTSQEPLFEMDQGKNPKIALNSLINIFLPFNNFNIQQFQQLGLSQIDQLILQQQIAFQSYLKIAFGLIINVKGNNFIMLRLITYIQTQITWQLHCKNRMKMRNCNSLFGRDIYNSANLSSFQSWKSLWKLLLSQASEILKECNKEIEIDICMIKNQLNT
ncbi:unnamed protein product [Paramecium sonneborni]|uniref:Uncharacterized protein n=1 Tax=Paramecium sonneborni TaxID=65129 RepID=A0A8S1K7N1_9CILI|nr:unnamed protein product [Paramecium sonneborni]